MNEVTVPSHYAQYLAERCGHECLETEYGFASYVINDDTVYITNIFVVPSMRRAGVGTHLADRICALARQQGCTRLLGSIDPSAYGAHESLLGLLAYGMTISHVDHGVVFFKKEL
jgi:GNAT superfamily N-acetyltransferase